MLQPQATYVVHSGKQFFSVVLPPNLLFLQGHTQRVLTTPLLRFFIYPHTSEYLVVYNYITRAAAFTHQSPFFIIFFSQSYFYLIKKDPLFTQPYKAIYWYAFNKLAKSLILASFGYCKIVQFVGFRFRQRWFRREQALRLRAGYNKKVWLKCPKDFISFVKKHNPKKRAHSFFSFDKNLLKQIVTFMRIARPATLYKGRGINLKEQPLELRDGKKTLW